MIYIILGGTNTGKTSFVVNSFVEEDARYEKDLIGLTYSGGKVLLGDYTRGDRRKGLDTIARTQIPLIIEQIKKLLRENPDRDLVMDGDRMISHKLFREIHKLKVEKQMYLMDSSVDTIKARNEKNVERGFDPNIYTETSIKATISRSKNMFFEYMDQFNGIVVDTNNVEDFSQLRIDNYTPREPKSEIRDDFCVFIVTHGRPDRVKTVKALREIYYTGPIYIVIDNEDKTADQYYERYGDQVVMFDKLEASKETDTADNIPDRRAVVFARNTVHKIARNMGYKYFLVLDDDYSDMVFRVVEGDTLKTVRIDDANRLFEKTLDFLDESKALTVAYAQAGDFIGGSMNKNYHKGILRKAMNVFFCRTDREFKFYGKINEDATTYVL